MRDEKSSVTRESQY